MPSGACPRLSTPSCAAGCLDHDWERWEREFEEDVRAGNLDFSKG